MDFVRVSRVIGASSFQLFTLVMIMQRAGYVLSVVLMTGASALAAACGDDNISTMPTSGTTGGRAGSSTGGKGGTGGGTGGSAIGGAAGTAGSGGSTGGSGGANGGSGGGTAGTAGAGGMGGGDASAGSAGTGGTSSDASPDNRTDATSDVSMSDAPTSDATDAQATDASDAGATDTTTSDAVSSEGGEAGPVAAKECFVTCNTADDCQPDGAIKALLCNAAHHCVKCIHDIKCAQGNSGWTSCTSDANCKPEGGLVFGDFCVDVEGAGYCAFASTNDAGCAGLTGTLTAKRFGGSEMVTVCADLSQTCDAAHGNCVGACDDLLEPTDCTPALGGNVCNTTTHKCECGSGADCGPVAPNCNLVTKQCECGTTNDCASDTGSTYVCE